MNKIRRNSKHIFTALIVLSVVLIISCGDNTPQDPSKFGNTKPIGGASDLSAFEVENGIGPIKSKLTLEKINLDLVKKGQAIFNTKCASCHKLDERYVGPAQRDVWERRTPEYILNMMLNPEEMYKRHPEAKKLLAEYMTPMPAQNLTMDDARALLEYFRKVAEEK
jgi:mono/diheme cytochrome c family protein